MYVQNIWLCGVLVFFHPYYGMYVSGTSDIRVGRNNIGFYLRFNLEKGIVGGNAKDSGEIQFQE